jgi:hypothetical protein
MLAYHQYGEPPEYEGTSESLFQLYRHRTAQCLQSGDISKGLPYTVEALRLNATAELNRKDDIRRGLWIMTGVMVRVAINMGYHRDPAHTPGLSVLQGEYRRRIWLSVIGMDDMTSFVGGFPRMMLAIHADTQEPRNLHDWELTEETTVLPPSRPLTEATSLTYLLVKSRLFKALGRVGDLTTSPAPASYETVLEIDRALRAAYDGFPPHMRLDNSPAGHKGPLRPNVRADFVGVSLLGMYHRGMCTLHRRWLAKSRVDDRYKLSRERCVSSALTTLGFQHGLESSWYALAQTRHMFILAGTVLVLELELRRKAPEEVEVPDGEVLVSALERSCANWAAVTATGDEALRFHRFLRGVVKGFRSRTSVEAGDGTEDRASQTLVAKQPEFDFHGVVPPLEISGGGLMFEQELPGMDIDWVRLSNIMPGAHATDNIDRLHGTRLSRTRQRALTLGLYIDADSIGIEVPCLQVALGQNKVGWKLLASKQQTRFLLRFLLHPIWHHFRRDLWRSLYPVTTPWHRRCDNSIESRQRSQNTNNQRH